MDGVAMAIDGSLFALAALLGFLCVRNLVKYARTRVRPQLMWGSGLGLAAAAMAIEGAVYLGVVSTGLLQLYIFLSAAIVGVLSLGATRVLRSPGLESLYTGYTLIACAATGIACALTPLSASMVVGGIIAKDPPLTLLVLSSLVTVPATVVLLAATALSLRRSFRWQTGLMAAGAIILGAGGTLYIASFPVALYYAEFIGILVLFLGLLSLPSAAPTPSGTPTHAPA